MQAVWLPHLRPPRMAACKCTSLQFPALVFERLFLEPAAHDRLTVVATYHAVEDGVLQSNETMIVNGYPELFGDATNNKATTTTITSAVGICGVHQP